MELLAQSHVQLKLVILKYLCGVGTISIQLYLTASVFLAPFPQHGVYLI